MQKNVKANRVHEIHEILTKKRNKKQAELATRKVIKI